MLGGMQTRTSLVDWQSFQLATTEYIPDTVTREALIMHGAGTANQTHVKNLAVALVDLGCRVVTFDFISHGLSTGSVAGLTLANRAEQARAIYDYFNFGSNSMLIGFSMSGQTAIDVMAQLGEQIACVVLFAPAIYDKAARSAHFGPGFSTVIRREESWRDSDAWDKLREFQGKLITFESPNDTIIPTGVIDLIHSSAMHTDTNLRIRVNNAPHTMGVWMNQDMERARWFANVIIRVLGGYLNPDFTQARTAGVDFEVIQA